MADTKEILTLIEEWEQNPQAMFDWRSKMMKIVLAKLQQIIESPPTGRSGVSSQLRAMNALTKIFERMEEIRCDIPVVCPFCDRDFTLK